MRSENRSPFLTAVPRDVISTGRSRTLILLIVDTPHTRVHRVYTCAWLSSMDTYVPFVHLCQNRNTFIKHDNDNAWIGDNPDRYLIGRLVGPIICPYSLFFLFQHRFRRFRAPFGNIYDLQFDATEGRGGSDAKFNQKCVFIVHVEREYLDSSNTNGQSVKKIT